MCVQAQSDARISYVTLLGTLPADEISTELQRAFAKVRSFTIDEAIGAAQTIQAIAAKNRRLKKHPVLLALANAVRKKMPEFGYSNYDRCEAIWGARRHLLIFKKPRGLHEEIYSL
jgi:hypothetical protein